MVKFKSLRSQLLRALQCFIVRLRIVLPSFLFSVLFLVLWLSSLLKAPASLPHTLVCVFEAGEHPHSHATTDLGFWLVLNPWQGALSLNIKDPHLRACRHDSHPDLSYSQQATWASNLPDVAGATGGPWSDAVISTVWAELGYICHPAMWTCKKNPSSGLRFLTDPFVPPCFTSMLAVIPWR